MSADTDGDRIADSEAIAESLHRWYHVPALAAVIAFLLWTRTRAYDRFVQNGEVFFRGNDAYYHYRATSYSVENWPRRLYGDPWTQFPYGTNVGHFGTLMDQVVATVALIVGLGDPSSRQIAIIAVLTPAVLAALITIPVYLLTKRLTGSRIGGVTAAVVLALIPQGGWVSRSSVGFYDHHVAEALMMATAVFAMVYALTVVRRERPVYEQVQDRDWDGLKPTVKASALAGLAIAAYLLTWPSGVVLVGIFGVFFVLVMSFAVATGRSPEHLAFVGTLSMLAAFVLTAPWVQSFGAGTTTLSLLQLLALAGVALGCAVMGALARYWERKDIEAWGYPAAISVLGIVAIAVVWLALPEVFGTVWSNMQRIFFLGQSDTTLTIGEAQSMFSDDSAPLGEQFWNGYGFTAFSALGALLWMGARAVLAKRPREEYMLICVWTVFLLLMTLTQVRFHYYLVLPVAVLNGWLVVQVVRIAAFPSLADIEDVQTYHVLTVLAVIAILVVPIAGPLAVTTSADTAEATGPSGVLWDDNLDWMAENTPEPGTYGGEDNAMSYYGPFDEIDDYEYPAGAYGVMSWWDYGHWITAEGERIPNANPFQQGPRASSAFLQETNESRANQYLEALPSESVSGGQLWDMSNESLQEAIDSQSEQEAGEDTRYVMIDDQMVGTKFGAITEWSGPEDAQYRAPREFGSGNNSQTLLGLSEQYDSTMLSRMYFNDGSSVGEADAEALSHYRLVYESPAQSAIVSVGQSGQQGTLQPVYVGIEARAMDQAVYQAAANQEDSRFQLYEYRPESVVKTYERVEGATITGEASPNATVQVSVPMETNTDRDFTYANTAQVGEDGQFELTVPYSTTNDLGPDDGYTNSSVVANGTYSVASGQAVNFQGQTQVIPSESAENVSVPETAIYDGAEVEVELEEVESPNETDGENGTGNASTGGDASGSTTTATSTTATASSSSSASAATGGAPESVATASAPAISGAPPTAASSRSATGAIDARSSLAGLADSFAAAVRSLAEPIAAPIAG